MPVAQARPTPAPASAAMQKPPASRGFLLFAPTAGEPGIHRLYGDDRAGHRFPRLALIGPIVGPLTCLRDALLAAAHVRRLALTHEDAAGKMLGFKTSIEDFIEASAKSAANRG